MEGEGVEGLHRGDGAFRLVDSSSYGLLATLQTTIGKVEGFLPAPLASDPLPGYGNGRPALEGRVPYVSVFTVGEYRNHIKKKRIPDRELEQRLVARDLEVILGPRTYDFEGSVGVSKPPGGRIVVAHLEDGSWPHERPNLAPAWSFRADPDSRASVVIGRLVCQTSPDELLPSIQEAVAGCEGRVHAGNLTFVRSMVIQ